MRIIFGILFPTILMSQTGWHTIKDKTGACQLSVPPKWTVLSTPGHASSPDHMDTTVLSGQSPYSPFSDETLHMLADKVFENSSQRSFYVTKAAGSPPTVAYHVEAPGRSNACIAQITASPSYSQDEIKKIASTLSAAK